MSRLHFHTTPEQLSTAPNPEHPVTVISVGAAMNLSPSPANNRLEVEMGGGATTFAASPYTTKPTNQLVNQLLNQPTKCQPTDSPSLDQSTKNNLSPTKHDDIAAYRLQIQCMCASRYHAYTSPHRPNPLPPAPHPFPTYLEQSGCKIPVARYLSSSPSTRIPSLSFSFFLLLASAL